MRKNALKVGSFLIVCTLLFIWGCEKQVTDNSAVENAMGVPTENIQWINWKPAIEQNFATLAKKGHDGEWITPQKGGVVGGIQTFNNSVSIPAGAVSRPTYVTVDVVRLRNGGAAVEFLPSMNFNRDVTITLSYKEIAISDQDVLSGNFKIYYSQDNVTWYPLDPNLITVNPDDRTISFSINHFTRYGWGF